MHALGGGSRQLTAPVAADNQAAVAADELAHTDPHRRIFEFVATINAVDDDAAPLAAEHQAALAFLSRPADELARIPQSHDATVRQHCKTLGIAQRRVDPIALYIGMAGAHERQLCIQEGGYLSLLASVHVVSRKTVYFV